MNGSARLPCLDMATPVHQPMRLLVVLVDGPLTSLTVLVGAVTSALSIALMLRLQIGRALVSYLVFLALWDLALLIVALLYYSLSRNLALLGVDTAALAYVNAFANGLAMTTMTGSIWIALSIACARYIAVCHPFSCWTEATKANATAICCAVSALAVLFSLPAYFELTVRACSFADGSGSSLRPWPTSLWRSGFYRFTYHVVLNFVFLTGLPFGVTLALTVGMIRAIRASDQPAESSYLLARSTAKARHASRMLVALLSKFLLCHVPPIALNVWETVGTESPAAAERFLLLASLSNYLVVLNSATNFFVYFWWRHDFANIPKRRSPRGAAHNETSTVVMVEMRSLSTGSVSIAHRLCERWLAAERRNFGQTGTIVLLAMLKAQPSLAALLGSEGMRSRLTSIAASSCSPKRRRSVLGDYAGVSRAGEQVGGFLERLLVMLGDGSSEAAVVAAVRRVGRAHARAGVQLSSGVWLEFRRALAKQMLGMSLAEFYERSAVEGARVPTEAHALSRLIAFIMAEMNKGATGCADVTLD